MELIHLWKLIHISDVNQLLLQYYLLIVEKRTSLHESFFVQQPVPATSTTSNDEGSKWILEPLLLCPLDPTDFLRRELVDVSDDRSIDRCKKDVCFMFYD